MTSTWIEETYDTLQGIYDTRSERLMADRGIADALITRWEYRKMTGREAPYGVKGLILWSYGVEQPIECGGCGNCGDCCGWGE